MSCEGKKVGDFTIYAQTSKQNFCLKHIERRHKSTTQGMLSTIKNKIMRNI